MERHAGEQCESHQENQAHCTRAIQPCNKHLTAVCVLRRCNVLDVESVRQVTHEISVSRLLCTTSTDKLIVRHHPPSPAAMT